MLCMNSLAEYALEFQRLVNPFTNRILKLQSDNHNLFCWGPCNMKATNWMVTLLISYLVTNIDSSAVNIEQFTLRAGLYYEPVRRVRFT